MLPPGWTDVRGWHVGNGDGFLISPDDVRQMGRAFRDEADRMSGRLASYREQMRTVAAMGDPASRDFSNALHAKLLGDGDSYVSRVEAYVRELTRVAAQCEAAAQAYGRADTGISGGLRGIGGGVV
ncbi:hypothetical protein GCM10029964_052100 [Kibdelosporangium lantanae]